MIIKPLKQSLEKFANFPNLTSFENNGPRLLLVAIDIQQGVLVVFNSYEKEYRTRYSEPEFDNKLQQEYIYNNNNKGMFEHVIRYDDGITSDIVLASCSVPVNYAYTKLNVQDHKLVSNEILQIRPTNMLMSICMNLDLGANTEYCIHIQTNHTGLGISYLIFRL